MYVTDMIHGATDKLMSLHSTEILFHFAKLRSVLVYVASPNGPTRLFLQETSACGEKMGKSMKLEWRAEW